MTNPEDLSSRLVEEIAPSLAWRDTFERVPRHRFIPDRIWIEDGDELSTLDRSDDPEAWLRACYTNQPVITQIDDGDPTGRGHSSSSASMPSIVALMLEATDLAAGQRVLEIGTGTGWNAALLADRVGAGNVTSVEIDPAVAARAEENLEGYGVRVVVGDGEKGCPPDALYDRVLATAAVQRVPYPWVEQTVPGGRIVTPWGTSFHNGTLLRLQVGADGTASGRFGGNAGFMWVRGQRTPHGTLDERVRPDHEYTESTTDLHPYEPVGDFDASFAIGLRVPGMKDLLVFDDDVPGNPDYTVYLMDPGSDSWASWRVRSGYREFRVRQHGPRHLFEELAGAYAWWQEAGRPEHSRFGVTVTRQGQRVWLDDPGNVLPMEQSAPGQAENGQA
ncbi:methyltransferase domain-containing protein [Nocardiopsis dassonvillei]|uniref:methyltransferase domain-containing protein n=1 Tax=Nocardiopsis dassonvillei TaxID=2014 RepID=UPI00200DFDBC|nr:methyltransferase domain-containing protein [Nocardiopsis dassonvillei]MCK9872155.1 methyltransferase domain-containing protein [Nocardiopsis dassonvillei]